MNRARLPLNGIAFRGRYVKKSTPSWGVAFPTGPGPSFQGSKLLPALLPQAHPASLVAHLGLGTQTSARWCSSLTPSPRPSETLPGSPGPAHNFSPKPQGWAAPPWSSCLPLPHRPPHGVVFVEARCGANLTQAVQPPGSASRSAPY